MSFSNFRAAVVALSLGFLTACSSSGSAPSAAAPQFGAPAASAFAPTVGDLQQEKPYFISFRARNAESYGHSFVVFGQFDANGNVPYDRNGVLIDSMTEVAGLHPASTSSVPYTLGHLVPVPAETGWSDGDTEKAYLTAEWTIPLTASQYQDVVGYIRQLQGSSPVWHAVVYNCSSFTNDIARHMGLRTPNHMLFPENYVNQLREMNT